MNSAIFHLSFPVRDIESTKEFYVSGLGCHIGRQSTVALMLDFHGHQLVAQVTEDVGIPQSSIYPRHFGLVCQTEDEWEKWRDLAQKHQLTFFREPQRRFSGKPIEHLSFFLKDPSDNLLEFKYYLNANAIFGEQSFSQIGDEHERPASKS
ncbi:MAG: VOC family protein [Nitrospirales bacterium]